MKSVGRSRGYLRFQILANSLGRQNEREGAVAAQRSSLMFENVSRSEFVYIGVCVHVELRLKASDLFLWGTRPCLGLQLRLAKLAHSLWKGRS